MTDTNQKLREAAQNALVTLDGIANANQRDTSDFETPSCWIDWAKSRASWAADALRAPIAQEVDAERILKKMLSENSEALSPPTQAEPVEGGEVVPVAYRMKTVLHPNGSAPKVIGKGWYYSDYEKIGYEAMAKDAAASIGDAAVHSETTVELLYTTPQPAPASAELPDEREAFESVLIDGIAYDIPAPVAGELLGLHISLQAQSANRAGDAVDAQRYRLLRTKIYIDPKELILRIRDVFLTSGATLPEMLDAAIDAAMLKGQL